MYELILIRHGETVFNSQERLQGGRDSPLTPRGQDEARKLGVAMAKFCGPIHAWYVSPQGRARQTSTIIRETAGEGRPASAPGLPEELPHEEIVEIRCGDWEGLRRSEIPAAELKRVHLSTDVAYPNGESIIDVSNRCENFLSAWQASLPDSPARPDPETADNPPAHRTVIISHGNLLRCMGGVLSG
ncbi:MAG: histidine phosphatase family protein, partial [Leptospirales bacterium]